MQDSPSLNTVLQALKAHGTAQNRKIYQRHGAGEQLFGVSFANLKLLKKKIGPDKNLALQLWATQNVDAQALAIMLMPPALFTTKAAQQWMADINYYLLAGELAGLVAQTDFAQQLAEKWRASNKEHYKSCGYTILSVQLKNGLALTEKMGNAYLTTIEKEIHAAPNRARYAMNNALIAIGIYTRSLTQAATAAAKRIGNWSHAVSAKGAFFCRHKCALHTSFRGYLVSRVIKKIHISGFLALGAISMAPLQILELPANSC